MVTHAAKALFFFLLLAAPSLQLAQTPYSDAAFRTFISVSVDGTKVDVRVTFLNITYFRELNSTKIGEVEQKVRDTQNIEDLYQQGDYSTESFTAEVLPLNGSSLRFTFEGMPVLDPAGNEICNPVITDENGLASCDIAYYRDANGEQKALEEYKSCGYATINLDELSMGGVMLSASSQTVTVCPAGVFALSAFGPAITSSVGSNLPFCFPAMLIAGLLVAAMYYSGRDPLSLFDITTPKLPRTPTFKVKMQTSPQMLRQVQRRYNMMKRQARRDSVREIARLARISGKSVSEARREMNALYDRMDALMKGKRKLSDDSKRSLSEALARMMEKYSPATLHRNGEDSFVKRFQRSLQISSGLLEAYIESHQASAAMKEARGKTGQGGLWSRYVAARMVEKGMDASVAFETGRTGRVLGRIPFVKKVVAMPTRLLDVASQLRGSRQSLKAIRGEFLGQVGHMLGTRTMLGKPVYNAFRRAHVTGALDGKGKPVQTRFGKAYTMITGRDWRTFENKHDLTTKKLVEFYNNLNSMRQHAIDAQNTMFRELFAKLEYALPTRANMDKEKIATQLAALALRMGIKPEDVKRLSEANALDGLFRLMQQKAKETKDKKMENLLKDMERALGSKDVERAGYVPLGKEFDAIQTRIEKNLKDLTASGVNVSEITLLNKDLKD
ncbi:MAG: hypothetical protein WC717_02530, partial [Candidatus Micrarchaeia archaeon]